LAGAVHRSPSPEVAALEQPSAQWTLAQLLEVLDADLSVSQRRRAVELLQRNLDVHDDWIVQNMTMQTLGTWAKADDELRAWLRPRLETFATSPRTSVAGRARKLLDQLP
jgi:hypothetical protein